MLEVINMLGPDLADRRGGKTCVGQR